MLRVVLAALALLLTIRYSSGKYCYSRQAYYSSRRTCSINIWGWCVTHKYKSVTNYRSTKSCCPGYTGSTCNTPICSPNCQNGGRCVAPGSCSCPVGTRGSYCQSVDGKWLPWSSWVTNQCSVTCGNGSAHSSRSRTCSPPRYGGKVCAGASTQKQTLSCNLDPCPVDGKWLQWSSWESGDCSVSCGNGTLIKTRNRTCDGPRFGGKNCEGSYTDNAAETCNEFPCPVDGKWLAWDEWQSEECSLSCGNGTLTKSRGRTCDGPKYGGKDCVGSAVENVTETCNEFPCPVDGKWREWTSWKSGICSVTCGNGTLWKARSRDCDPPQHGGKNCPGSNVENVTQECIMRRCPVCENGQWSSWSTWEACSVTCGSGVKHRERSREITGDPECTMTEKQSGLGYCEQKKCLRLPCIGNEKVRHPVYCTDYFECNDTAFVRKACPDNEDFNEKLGLCSPDQQEECNFTMPGTPPFENSKNLFDVLNKEFTRKFGFHDSDMPRKEDRMLEMLMRMFPEIYMAGYCTGNTTRVHPLDCSRYMQCTEGQLYEKKCPSGERWNPSVEECQPEGNVECRDLSKDHPCGQLFGFYPVTSDCTKYHMCIYGHTHTYQCEEGNVFESTTGYCRQRLESDKC